MSVKKQRLVLTLDAPALQAAAQLDGCYVVETDLKATAADAQTIHDRYKDLAFVERDFRTLKTGHLKFRPWFVCTPDNTQAHALRGCSRGWKTRFRAVLASAYMSRHVPSHGLVAQAARW